MYGFYHLRGTDPQVHTVFFNIIDLETTVHTFFEHFKTTKYEKIISTAGSKTLLL